MKELFYIDQRVAGETGSVLSIQVGEKHAAFAITDQTGDRLHELGYCICKGDNEQIDEAHLDSFVKRYPSVSEDFDTVSICFDHLSSLVHQPEQTASSQTELIPGLKLYSQYPVPAELLKTLEQKFPTAKKRQIYPVLLNMISGAGEEATIFLDFRKDDFNLVAVKEKNLLIARSFEYSVPADVIFYLIKTCRVFSLTQEQVSVQVCGLIDRQSSLFSEIFQYFRHVEFREAAWSNDTGFPKHFFTSLNEIARCAS